MAFLSRLQRKWRQTEKNHLDLYLIQDRHTEKESINRTREKKHAPFQIRDQRSNLTHSLLGGTSGMPPGPNMPWFATAS